MKNLVPILILIVLSSISACQKEVTQPEEAFTSILVMQMDKYYQPENYALVPVYSYKKQWSKLPISYNHNNLHSVFTLNTDTIYYSNNSKRIIPESFYRNFTKDESLTPLEFRNIKFQTVDGEEVDYSSIWTGLYNLKLSSGDNLIHKGTTIFVVPLTVNEFNEELNLSVPTKKYLIFIG